jgi:uncharacterized membrane protein
MLRFCLLCMSQTAVVGYLIFLQIYLSHAFEAMGYLEILILVRKMTVKRGEFVAMVYSCSLMMCQFLHDMHFPFDLIPIEHVFQRV